MTMTFKEACKDVLDTIVTCLTDKENYKLIIEILILGGLAVSSFLSGVFTIIGTVSIVFTDAENLKGGSEWLVPVAFLVSLLTGFTTAVLIKMWEGK